MSQDLKQLVVNCVQDTLQTLTNRMQIMENKIEQIILQTNKKFESINNIYLKLTNQMQEFRQLQQTLNTAQELAYIIVEQIDVKQKQVKKVEENQMKALHQIETKIQSQLNNQFSNAKQQNFQINPQTNVVNDEKLKNSQTGIQEPDIVYYTKKGKKFHKMNCGSFGNSKEVLKITKQQAIADGLESCGICKV